MEENKNQSDENVETIMEVDSFVDDDDDVGEYEVLCNNYVSMSEASSHNISTYSLDDDTIMINEEDVASSSNDISSNIFQVEKKINESTSIEKSDEKSPVKNKIEENSEVKITNQQIPIKRKTIPSIIASASNSYSLNLKNNTVKKTDGVKLNVPLLVSSQIHKTSPISNVTTTSVFKPTATTMLQPKSNISQMNYNESFSKKQKGLNISPIESKSNAYVNPHNSLNYIVQEVEEGELSKSLDTVTEPINQKKTLVMTTSKLAPSDFIKESRFVAQMQKLPDGKFKVLPSQGKVPPDLENVFRRNPQFVKQKAIQNFITNELKLYLVPTRKSLVKSNQIQITSTNEMGNIQQRNMSKENFSQDKKSKASESVFIHWDKKLIPYTSTSENATVSHINTVAEKSHFNSKSNSKEESCISSGFIQRSSNIESLIQSDGPLSITRYGKITKKDNIAVQAQPIDSLDKSKTKLNINSKQENQHLLSKNIKSNVKDTKHSISSVNATAGKKIVFPCKSFVPNEMKINRNVNIEHCENTKLMFSNEAQNDYSDEEDDNKSGQFVSCQYEYCDTLVHEPELIDCLYCSYACKKLDSKKVVAIEEPIVEVEEITNPPPKPVIDRKQLLAKLENRINKRKQLLTSTCPEKIARNDDWDELQFENSYSEPPVDESPPPSLIDTNKNESPVDDEIISFNVHDFKGDTKLMKYMDDLLLNCAPKHLFDKPIPTEENFFQVGHKLEGIDPEHEALICVMSVVEVCGYRIKLHFDGYSSEYNFWVNADCPDLFYATWCEQNSRTVLPPKDYAKKFDWTTYLKECHASAAPKCSFSSTKNLANCQLHKFHIGAKLEALDKLTRTLPKQLICVATVADILGNRIRIHFDGWTDDFDYWTDITSTNIHPVKWCENNGRSLSPPSGYNDLKGKKPFSWTEYLKETNSKPVPEDAFVRRPLRDFTINMAIEVVDLVIPSLLRIARVVDIKGDELKILYDGFQSIYAYWVEDDSPDIHPVGWSIKTSHPLEIPTDKNSVWSCGVIGCSGKGNSNSLGTNHVTAKDCPYELDLWKKAVAGLAKIPDRLKTDKILLTNTSTTTSIKPQTNVNHEDEKKGKHKLSTAALNNPLKPKGKINYNKSNDQLCSKNIGSERSTETRSVPIKTNSSCIDNMELRKDIGLSLIAHDMSALSMANRGKAWTRHNAQLGIPFLGTDDARKWSVKQVASYVDEVVSTKYLDRNTHEQISVSSRFIDQEIDGEAFLMLTQDDIMKILKIPLGPAIKLSSAIVMLRTQVPVF